MSPPSSSKEASARRAISPLVALVLHAALAWVLWKLPPPSPPPPSPPPPSPPPPSPPPQVTASSTSEELIIEVTASIEPQASFEPPSDTRALPQEVARSAAKVPHETGRPASTERDSTRAAPAEPDLAAGADREGDGRAPQDHVAEGSVFAPGPSVPDIGIGGTNRFLPKSERELEEGAAKVASEQVLRHTGWERDRALGLGPEGPMLTALADGTSQSVAPVRGRAIFVATTNGDGEVVSLELEDAEGGRPGWNDARRIALAALQGKKLRVPSSAKRVVMKIEVVSAWKLPSGQDPGTNITLFHVPISKGEGKDSATMTILDPIPKVRVDYLEIGPGVKIPVPSVQLDLFGTNADPTNAGAKPRRVIHTHLIDSTVM